MNSLLVLTLLFCSAFAYEVTTIEPCFYDSLTQSNTVTNCVFTVPNANVPTLYHPGSLQVWPYNNAPFSSTFGYTVSGLTPCASYTLHLSAIIGTNNNRTVDVKFNGASIYTYVALGAPFLTPSYNTAYPTTHPYQWTVSADCTGPDTVEITDSDGSNPGGSPVNYYYAIYLVKQ